ncbi:MAG: chemotaxis protein CheA [Nevskiaceae bacterium]|nr:MAG: chemotaxis protein CheA [Nevskiaceae bacterium]TBR72180.1 MAG: chemotaxis protein CheA [Nevskiaceae bacterium]
MSTPATDPALLADFLDEAGDWMEKLGADLMALDGGDINAERINRLFRGFHTIKGGAGFMNMEPMAHLCHAAEDLINVFRNAPGLKPTPEQSGTLLAALTAIEGMLQTARDGGTLAPATELCTQLKNALAAPDPNAEITEDEFEALLDQLQGTPTPAATETPARPAAHPGPAAVATSQAQSAATAPPAHAPAAAPKGETTLRVDIDRLDRIMGLVGELVLARNRLKALHPASPAVRAPALAELDRAVSTLQSAVMQVRMQPVNRLFARVPRMVRELSHTLGKQVRLELAGEDTELDKTLVDALGDPLIHLIRNALDHGIETPRQRHQAGKPEQGLLALSASQEGENVIIELRDDGAGIDPAKVRNRAIDKGLISMEKAASLSMAESQALLFLPGFSTSEKISEVSGRGVGLDVVKSSLAVLGGHVEVESEPGHGCTFRLRVPLTLSILPTLMANVGPQVLAIPLSSVREVFQFDRERVQRIEGQPNLLHNGGRMPLVDLRERFSADPDTAGLVVSIQRGTRRCGLVVDAVSGREEVVIKPLGDVLTGKVPFSGAAVLGDGRIALVLDPEPILSPPVA